MNEADWLRQHAAVLFDIDAAGRLAGINEPDPEGEAPLAFVARGIGVPPLVLVRADVSADVAGAVARAAAGLPAWDGARADPGVFDAVRAALVTGRGSEVGVGVEGGPAFRFPPGWGTGVDDGASVPIDEAMADRLERHFPYTRTVLAWRAPVTGVVRDGVVVAACYVARRRGDACEAGVATAEAYRGRGFALAAVSAWARLLQARSMTPLYSTSWDNAGSLAVAARLGLEAYADTASFG